MFSFFKKKPPPAPLVPVTPPVGEPPTSAAPIEGARPSFAAPATGGSLIGSALVAPIDIPEPGAVPPERQKWVDKLKSSLGKTAGSISTVFGGSLIDEALYENLEDALLMADAGVLATQYLLTELRRKVNDSGVTHPVALKNILTALLTELLQPLQKPLVIGEHKPTVVMVAGVNGAGKTTFVRGALRSLGVTGAIKSPTYALVESYKTARGEVHHLDAYRIENVEDFEARGGFDYFAMPSIRFVEWPQRLDGAVSFDTEIRFYFECEGRRVSVSNRVAP